MLLWHQFAGGHSPSAQSKRCLSASQLRPISQNHSRVLKLCNYSTQIVIENLKRINSVPYRWKIKSHSVNALQDPKAMKTKMESTSAVLVADGYHSSSTKQYLFWNVMPELDDPRLFLMWLQECFLVKTVRQSPTYRFYNVWMTITRFYTNWHSIHYKCK